MEEKEFDYKIYTNDNGYKVEQYPENWKVVEV